MNKKKRSRVSRVVRYCTVSMAIASSRIRCDSRSASGKLCAGNGVRKTSRHGNRVLNFFLNRDSSETNLRANSRENAQRKVRFVDCERKTFRHNAGQGFARLSRLRCTMPFASFACQMCP
ncbi:hypothetical protein ALC57_06646 [Trachymyrmex cornetzi]|uniref:Uncharacterized protein n=1 Tax=Trachymyrmex cornetzi TaxID=471704 RepID=A0A195E6B0_9HYME|nr:hypothetical protein ALC57_06646 [Trachymyrmex cornetzi]